MPPLDALWLALAGLGGGLAGSVAGLASLVSYPALLAAGLPALSANMTNTVALVFSGVGSTLGSRPELTGQAPRLRRLAAVAVAGGACGAALLLVTPAKVFTFIVPGLIAAASLAIVARRPPRLPAPATGPARARPVWLLDATVFAITLYGGYFGAAAGVILLAVLLVARTDGLARSNAVKNLLLGLANAVAAVTFAFAGPVHWLDALPLAAGFLLGGRIGPTIVRRVPAGPLRALIACAGLGLAVRLGIGAYT